MKNAKLGQKPDKYFPEIGRL